MTRRLIYGALVLALAAHIVSLVNSRRGQADARATGGVTYRFGTGFERGQSNLDPTSVKSFGHFPLYSAGDNVDGYRLTAIARRIQPLRASETHRANYVSFIYGACTPEYKDSGCPAPVEIQIWPACERSLNDYHLSPGGPALHHDDLTLRGVPAAEFADGRLELYAGRVTIVIFGVSRDERIAAANALEGVNVAVSRAQDLPRPLPAALAGTLACSTAEGSM